MLKIPPIKGRVISGDAYGRTIGYPTANIDVDATLLGIDAGVYAAIAKWNGNQHDAALMIDTYRNRVEVYILDFSGDLYDHEITVEPVQWIRSFVFFERESELIVQIEKDIADIRHILGYYVHGHH